MSKTTRIVWTVLTSRTLAVWLLAVVTVMLAVGAMLPNPALLSPAEAGEILTRHPLLFRLGEQYNSQELAKNWFFASAGIVLILSTTLCSIDRLITRYRFRERKEPAFPAAGSPASRMFSNVDAAEVGAFAVSWLKKNRYRVRITREGPLLDITGKKGEAGFLGSIFFHGILITALFGMVIYYFAGYRARLAFTEGQTYVLREDRFYRVDKRPLWGFRMPDVEMGLLNQFSFYSPEVPSSPSEYVARFRVRNRASGKSWTQDVRINEPMTIGGRKFLLVVGGYSPRITVLDRTGQGVFDNYVALKNDQGTRDIFGFGPGEVRIEAKLYPDYIFKDGKHGSRSLQLKNPFLSVTMLKGARIVGETLLPLGGNRKAAGYTIDFPDLRRWVEMEMVGEPGIDLFFIVLFLGVAGIALRMLDPDELFHVLVKQDGINVHMQAAPWSPQFPGLIALKAEEFDRLSREKFNQAI